MNMSIKNEMMSVLNDLHWQLEQAELELSRKIKSLEDNNIKTLNFAVDNRKNWFKTIVNYMSNGLTYDQSVQLLCLENDFDQIRINNVLNSCNVQRKATEMFAKIYMIKMLKQADFTNKKIADIMKISACTVAKLIKCAAVSS